MNSIQPRDMGDFELWQEKVQGANISSQTLLATDYLNHFNEIVMLIDMVPDMPELLEECRMWAPKSYQDHFRDSAFSHKELAIDSYDHVPNRFRLPFEETVERLNALVLQTVERLGETVAAGDDGLLRERAQTSSRALQRLMDVANAIIHGSEHAMGQNEIDDLLGI